MYELVNTSVPNGLVAGTHGFSTVSMTKGMPDSVRTRVENFCSYPHRVSARDQRYWDENPVNWFHLILPGGDHVVGRTAPAEFDYTGRTNRLAHVLYFTDKEMPLNGGAFVLASEEQRLSEGWSGEPRYLKEDKATAGRLRMANPVANGEPSNWIRMFGPQGREYARRFAVLLANNISGAGKSIYFKTSSSCDSDGTQLFGLFSDLINLLPNRLAPLATFSTFSACVPSGVTCHLRGIFDRDRAFEVASALQPWVDCETCEVKHAELLPEVKVAASTPSVESPTRIATTTAYSTAITSAIGVQRVQNRQPQSRAYAIANKQKGDSSLIWAIAGSVVVILATVALILYIVQPQKGTTVSVEGNPNGARFLKDRIAEWQSVHACKLQELESKLDQCTEYAQLEKLINEINDAQKDAKKSFDKEFGEDAHDEAGNVMRLYGQLVKRVERKKDELKRREDNVDVDKRSDEASTNVTRKVKNKNLEVNDDAEKRPNKDKQVKKEETKLLIDWPPPEVVKSIEDTINGFKMSDKGKLLATNSLVYCYVDNKQLKFVQGQLKSTSKDQGGARRRTSFSQHYQIDPPLPKMPKWVAVYIPRQGKTYWQWNNQGDGVKLFEGRDEVNLKDIVFGDNDAYGLFRKSHRIIYAVSWTTNGGRYRLFSTYDCLKVGRFMQDYEENVRRAIKKLDGQIKGLEQEIAGLNCKSNKAETIWYPDMLKRISQYEKQKHKSKKIAEKGKDKGKKGDGVKEELAALEKSALSCFTNFPSWSVEKNKIQLSTITTNACNIELKNYKKKIGDDIQNRNEELRQRKREKDGKEKDLQTWKMKVKERKYNVALTTQLPEDVCKTLSGSERERYSNLGEVDYIRKPTDVNGN